MKSAWAIAACALAGCANANLTLDSSGLPNAAPAPGTAYGSAAVHAELRSSGWFGLFVLGYLAAGAAEDGARMGLAGAPPLDAERAIAERDCSRPIGTPSANLRCK